MQRARARACGAHNGRRGVDHVGVHAGLHAADADRQRHFDHRAAGRRRRARDKRDAARGHVGVARQQVTRGAVERKVGADVDAGAAGRAAHAAVQARNARQH